MTASAEAVIAAQTQQPGCLDYTLFQDAYLPFLRGAYDQFNETQYLTPSAGQSNPAFDFATGAGGFLQTFTYGFAGLRWGTDTLTLAPTLPPQLATGITINGLQYQGRTLTVAIGATTTTVTLNSGSPITLNTPSGTRNLTSAAAVTLPTARPDLTATDNAARCQNATASSWQAVDPPAAAVDGNPVTTWTAASTTSTYTVTLPSPVQTGHIDIEWGPTRPANYTIQIQSPSGAWQQVTAGSVPASGNLYTTWTPVATSALKLTFTAGGDASIAELTMPNAVVPDGATVEAEDAILSGGAGVATDHANYTGGGFVDGLYSGADITANYSIPAAGAYQVTIRYANSTGGQNPPYQNVTRTISLVGSGTTQQVSLPVTGSWDTWSTATTTVDLPAGTDTIQLLVGPNDSGSINIDSVTVH